VSTFSVTKDPDADLDYSIDWTPWLGAETIASSAWTIAPAPDGALAQHDAGLDVGNKIATVWLRGGNLHAGRNEPYTVTNTVTDTAGRTDQRSIAVTIIQR
jgi:hypothetical protein